jgi:hypothetical protein
MARELSSRFLNRNYKPAGQQNDVSHLLDYLKSTRKEIRKYDESNIDDLQSHVEEIIDYIYEYVRDLCNVTDDAIYDGHGIVQGILRDRSIYIEDSEIGMSGMTKYLDNICNDAFYLSHYDGVYRIVFADKGDMSLVILTLDKPWEKV